MAISARGGLSAVLLLCAALGGCRDKSPAPSPAPAASDSARASRRVVVMVMPLEGDGSSEAIELAESGGLAELRVRRLLHDEPVRSETARVPLAELDRVWQLVERERLTELSPPEPDPSVSRGSSRMLQLEWPDAEGKAKVHVVHWSNPKRAHPGLDRLFRELADRARAHARGVKLEFFR